MPLQTGIFGGLLEEQRQQRMLEARSSLENPQTPLSYPAEWLLDIFNGGRTDSGIRVSELTAFQASYFLACVDLIAGSIAALPKYPYERVSVANSRVAHRIAYDHDLYDLITLEPNDEMSQFVFTKAYFAAVLAWGNGYAEIQRDASNTPVAIWPRNPYKTRPHRLLNATRLEPVPWRPFPVNLPAGSLVYRTTDGIEVLDESDAENGQERFICKEDMLHIPGLAFDGRIGQSVVWLARQTIGLALATEKFGAKYFANYARPSGILVAPALTAEQRNQAKNSWMEAQGGENSHRVAVMPPGFDFKPISNDPEKSQLTESEDKIRNKICAFFHVSPRMVGDTEKGGRNTSEQEFQEFLQLTLTPWLQAYRMEWKRKLFPSSGIGRTPRNKFYVDFDVADMLRPDADSREKFYATGRQWGFLCANDVREMEKKNPIEEPWAEQFIIPINMTLSTTPLDPNHQDGAGNGDKPDDLPAERYVQHYSRIWRDAFGRVLAREKRDLRVLSGAFGAVLFSVRDAWFDLAKLEMRCEAKPGSETDKFVAEYLGAMQQRAASWSSEGADEAATTELRRAIQALRIAAYREAATLKAKEGEAE